MEVHGHLCSWPLLLRFKVLAIRQNIYILFSVAFLVLMIVVKGEVSSRDTGHEVESEVEPKSLVPMRTLVGREDERGKDWCQL